MMESVTPIVQDMYVYTFSSQTVSNLHRPAQLAQSVVQPNK